MERDRLYDYAKLKLLEIQRNFENLPSDLDFSNNLDLNIEEFKQIIQEFILKVQEKDK